MTLFFRVMRSPYRRFSHTGPFRKNPAASNGGPQPRAQRSGSRLEAKKFPVRYWAPPQVRRTSIFAVGKNLGAGGIHFRRAILING